MPPIVHRRAARTPPASHELFEYAALSVEMALSRGGDQAVVKNKFNFEFYGGRNKELEKRTKVKSRVMADALGELDGRRLSASLSWATSSPTWTASAPAAGVCAIGPEEGGRRSASSRRPGSNPASRDGASGSGGRRVQDAVLSQQDAIVLADANCLLVVVDTNRPEQVVSQDLLEAAHRVAVIDHHRRACSYIADAALNFHEPYASSASELVTELLQYLLEPADLLKTEAEALLAGMVLDTKQFTMRTGSRTFEAAAFLRRSGADTGDVQEALPERPGEGTIAKYDIIPQRPGCTTRDIAVTAVDHTDGPRDGGPGRRRAAEHLAASTPPSSSSPTRRERMIISARSMGNANVQVVLEKLGGGGNAATAGAQVPGQGRGRGAPDMLLQAIDAYLEEE
ncbi:MAG: DHH family phosphoesterase [Flavonifractor plautii]